MAALGEVMSMPAANAAFELLSVVWTEAALFGCAAIAYLAFSGSHAFRGKNQMKKVFTKVSSPRNREVPAKLSKPKGSSTGSPKSRASSIPCDPTELRALVKETPAPLSRAFAKAVLEACAASKDVELTADVFEKVDSADAAELRAFAEGAAARLAKGAAQSTDANTYSGKDPTVKARNIRMLGKAGDLEAAIALFEETLPSYESGPQARGKAATLLFNGVIDACAECKDLDRASSYLARARALELADAVSFNTLMKGYLAAGDEDTAQKLLQELPKIAGCQATQASFHGLMNARVSAGDARGAWRCLADMQAAGVTPNTVSCAILLKGVATPKDAADMHKVLELIEGQGQPVDEVLLSSMVDACLRSGQLHFLARFMEQRRSRGEKLALSAPAYGSLIKAYGQARDVKNVWAIWHEMLEREVQPSQITLGCMVEALVTNRCAEEAWQMVQEMWGADEAKASLVNTVSVSTLLKGFAREPEKVIVIYEEMRARKIQSNVITYNTILNAFAEGGAMHRAPALLEDMKVADPPVEPDVVTYSTLIKGFCSSGDLDRALGLLEQMKEDAKYAPDEMMYNSLLDGCAKEQRVKDALKLIADMRASGVAPSNYTLTMLIKLLGRCRMLNQAFSIVDDLTKAYSIRPNIQVYTCLIQACFQNRQHGKAVSLLDRLIADGIQPDEKTYTALVRGCVQARQVDQAVKMVRRAYQDNSPVAGVDSKTLDEVIRKLGAGSEAAESLLADVRSQTAAGTQVQSRRKPQSSEKPGSKQASANAPWRRGDRSASGSSSDTRSGMY